MTDKLKIKLIQQHIQTYYEAGGAALPSAYKSAVIDMIDTVASIEALNRKMPTTDMAIETDVKENEHD